MLFKRHYKRKLKDNPGDFRNNLLISEIVDECSTLRKSKFTI
jgi:hypothetical protein